MNLLRVYNFFVIVLIATIWLFMCAAKLAKYDMNYAYAIVALLISLFTTIAIIVVWIAEKQIVIDSAFVTKLFLITSSPISLFLVASIYEEVVGGFFKH